MKTKNIILPAVLAGVIFTGTAIVSANSSRFFGKNSQTQTDEKQNFPQRDQRGFFGSRDHRGGMMMGEGMMEHEAMGEDANNGETGMKPGRGKKAARKMGYKKIAGVVSSKNGDQISVTSYSPFGDKKEETFTLSSDVKFTKVVDGEKTDATYDDLAEGDKVFAIPARPNLTDEQKTQLKDLRDEYKAKFDDVKNSDKSDAEKRDAVKSLHEELKSKVEEIVGKMEIGRVVILPDDFGQNK